jgi:hypothetical protein
LKKPCWKPKTPRRWPKILFLPIPWTR